jgi:pimeloyl-ACP methyl ester carboxylesterase
VPFLDRDGVRIYYEGHGQGPPILLSHGYSATCRMWEGQIGILASRYRVIVWDMRGHGESDDPDDPAAYSEALTVEDMAALLRLCQIDRAVIGGLSLGGYMSLAFHLAHPEMVRALMLFDTGSGFRNAEARRAWNERAQQRARDLEARGFAALGESDEVRMSKHRSARGMLAQAYDNHIIAGLDKIAVPTLVLVGADDTHFLAAADYIAQDPGCRAGDNPRCRARIQPASAGRLQPRRPGFSRRLASGVTVGAALPLCSTTTTSCSNCYM